MDWLTENSQKVINSIRAIILMLAGFRVVEVTTEQLALIIATLETVFATITAKTTVSSGRVDVITEKRVEDRMTGMGMTGPSSPPPTYRNGL